MIKTYHIKVTTAGGAGVAVGNADSSSLIVGEVVGVYLKSTGQPATVDTVLKTKGSSAPSYILLTVTSSVLDGFYAPRAKPVDNANAAIANAHAPFSVADFLNLDVAQGDAAGTVEAWVLVDDKRDSP